jgi:hypothetical protein
MNSRPDEGGDPRPTETNEACLYRLPPANPGNAPFHHPAPPSVREADAFYICTLLCYVTGF